MPIGGNSSFIIGKPEAIFSLFGFDFGDPEERICFAPAAALSTALAVLPLLLLLLLDTDRAIPLAFLPAVWLSWKAIRAASPIELWLIVWALSAMILSAFCSDHVARALVMTSATGWTLAGALVARNLAPCVPAVRLVLTSIVVGAILGMLMVCLGVGANRMFFPTYWSARLFGAHQFAGCIAVLGLLSLPFPNPRYRPIVLFAAVLVWTGLAWSGSRAPVLGLGVTLVIWFWRGSTHERRLLLQWTPILSIAALLLSLPLGNPYPQLGWWEAFERTTSATSINGLSSERSKFWMVVWQHIIQSPWIGHGADAYLFVYPRQNGNQPHNVVLQWGLDYGLVGTLPLCLLLLTGIRGLLPFKRGSISTNPPLLVWGTSALAGTIAYGLFDGVFYHMIIFMPAAVIAGLAFGQQIRGSSKFSTSRIPALFRPVLLVGLILLLVHNWLNFMLLRANNVQPDSPPARILRIFPSITYGLQNWTDAWGRNEPEVAMEWLKWAETVSTEQNLFHVHAAQIYLWRKEFRAAEAELLQAMKKGPEIERDDLMTLITKVRASALAKEEKAKLSAPVENLP